MLAFILSELSIRRPKAFIGFFMTSANFFTNFAGMYDFGLDSYSHFIENFGFVKSSSP